MEFPGAVSHLIMAFGGLVNCARCGATLTHEKTLEAFEKEHRTCRWPQED